MDESARHAQRVFEWVHQRPHVRVGQSLFAASDDAAREEATRIEPLLDALESDDRIVYAPTPWHAAIYLELVVEPDDSLKPKIYRGQSDSAWDIISSAQRPGLDHGRVEKSLKALRLLAIALSRHWGYEFPLDAGIEGAAQHYGIPTTLLDFTIDPQVAVYFAAQSNTEDPNQLAVVFSYEFEQAANFGARAVFPHPLAKRIYDQRGLFVDMSYCDRSYLRKWCYEVRFPPDPAFQPFRDQRPISLLEASDVFSPLVSLAWEWAERDADDLTDANAGRLVRERFNEPPTESTATDTWAGVMTDVLTSLCFDPGELNPRTIHTAPIDVFVRDNPEVARRYYDLVRPKMARRTSANDLMILAFQRAFGHGQVQQGKDKPEHG